jgi:putative ribosome biogenesis GTPase RsgA
MSHNPLVVVIGQIGSGRTTLVNKICNSELPTDNWGKSVTQIYSLSSAYGNGFYVYDTPGFGNDEKKV